MAERARPRPWGSPCGTEIRTLGFWPGKGFHHFQDGQNNRRAAHNQVPCQTGLRLHYDNVVTVNKDGLVLKSFCPLGEDSMRVEWSIEAHRCLRGACERALSKRTDPELPR
jgi:hypothetical protein